MELIVAVYDDWGIGRDGTQPIALSADRKFFRETTKGAMVIAGRRTIGDFPGQKPLPGRVNVAMTRSCSEIPGFTVCASAEEALELAKTAHTNHGQSNKRIYTEKPHRLQPEYSHRPDLNILAFLIFSLFLFSSNCTFHNYLTS